MYNMFYSPGRGLGALRAVGLGLREAGAPGMGVQVQFLPLQASSVRLAEGAARRAPSESGWLSTCGCGGGSFVPATSVFAQGEGLASAS